MEKLEPLCSFPLLSWRIVGDPEVAGSGQCSFRIGGHLGVPRINSASDVQVSLSEIARCCYFPRQLTGRF
jgi:hypothetical protein